MEQIVPREFAIVIPAKNEQDSIAAVITEIRQIYAEIEIFVVNDASSDDTGKILEELDVVTIQHVESMGAWQATQTGLLSAYQNGHEFVVTMDADGQHLASEIHKLISKAKNSKELDVIVGACPGRASLIRRYCWLMFKAITGINIQDITSGFRVYNRSALAVLTTEQVSLLEYQDVGVLLFLKSARLRAAEVPVNMKNRQVGKSRIFSSWVKIVFYVFSTLLLSFAKAHPENKNALFKRLR